MILLEVVCGIIYRGDKIFVCRRKEGKHLEGYWEFPGGKLENGETKVSALKRELKEELSMEVEVERYIGFNDHNYLKKKIRLHAFRCTLISYWGVLKDHDEFLWLDPKEIYSVKLAPADIPLINKL